MKKNPRRNVRKNNENNFLCSYVYIDKITFTVAGNIYNTKKNYFLELNPNNCKTYASANEIFRFCYHNVKEFRDYKRAFYRERYRQKINNNVRQYIKYQTNTTEQNSNENN